MPQKKVTRSVSEGVKSVDLQRFNLASSGVVPLLRDCTQSLSSARGAAKSTA
jgi:hypothetical protein